MAYQLDYKKVYNTFGPKNKRERYGTEIGKQVNNLMASFNTQLPARYGLFLNKDYNPESYNPEDSEEVYPGNGIRIFWPEKENTWYYVRQDVAWNDNFCVGKLLYGYDEDEDGEGCILKPFRSHSSNSGLNEKLYGRSSTEPLKSFIHIPVKPGGTYCLQFINNNNITTSETSYNYPDLYLFAEGVRDDGTKCIFANFAMGHEVWNGWYKHISSNQINFHCFLQMPEEAVLSVLTKPADGTPANDYIKITGYILGILYPYSYKGVDSETGEIVPYDSEMQGFLWESDRPALVDQNGIVTQYIDEDWSNWTRLPDDFFLEIMETELIQSNLLRPYSRNGRQQTDTRPILTNTGSNSFSVQVPQDSIAIHCILRRQPFRNWLWVNKKELIVVPIRLHLERNKLPRRMLNEKGKKTYSTLSVRRLIEGVPRQQTWPAYVGSWVNNDWVFPDIQFSHLNSFSDFLGIDGYNSNNEPYTTIGFCFSVRKKHHDSRITIPGGLYAEYIPPVQRYLTYTYIPRIQWVVGADTVQITATEPITGTTYVQMPVREPGPIPIITGYDILPTKGDSLTPISFTPPVSEGWKLISVVFDEENITGSFKDPTLDLTMLEDFPTYSEDGKTIYIEMKVFSPDRWSTRRTWEINIPYTATYRRSI